MCVYCCAQLVEKEYELLQKELWLRLKKVQKKRADAIKADKSIPEEKITKEELKARLQVRCSALTYTWSEEVAFHCVVIFCYR